VSASITDAAAGEYVYLIKNDQNTVLGNLASAPQTALDNLRGLSDELWSRTKVAEDGSVNLTTEGLIDGVYKVVAMDLAGNFSPEADNEITVSGSTVTPSDTLFDVSFSGIDYDGTNGVDSPFDASSPATAGSVDSKDNTAKVHIELTDIAEGDTVELYADGLLVYSNAVTATDVTNGSLQTGNIDFAANADDVSTADGNTETVSDEKVILDLKVKHGDTYVQDGVTWEYQW
jgi:hypothetical protein